MSTLSPNMSFPISTVAVDSGLNWELNLNAALTIIDQHTHSPGSGVQIQPSGLDINTDLSLQNNNLIQTRSVILESQGAVLSTPIDIGSISNIAGNLYFNNNSGVPVQITSGGSIVGTAGSITGLPSGTAEASFAASTFVFQAATNTPANVDGASFIFRNNVANSKGLTLSPPNAMASDYSLVLPAVPGTLSFMTLDTSGNMSGSIPTLGTLTTSNLSSSAGILGSQLANLTINTAQIANGAITSAKIGNGEVKSVNMDTDVTISNSLTTTAVIASGSITQDSLKVVVNGANAGSQIMSIARGTFDSAGNVLVTQGTTCVRNSAGVYTVTYTNAFGARPSVVASIDTNSAGFAYVSSSIAGSCVIHTVITGVDTDAAFSIIAIGYV